MKNSVHTSLIYLLLAIIVAGLLLGLYLFRPLTAPATADDEAESPYPQILPISENTALTRENAHLKPILVPAPDHLQTFTFLATKQEDYLELLEWLKKNQLLERGLAVLPQVQSLKIRLQEGELQRLLRENERITYAGEIFLRLPERPEDRADWQGYAGLAFGNHYREFLGVDSADSERGVGCVVALLDTPLSNHPALHNSDILTQDLFGLVATATLDERNHGTAVASIIAGADGISPGVTLLSLPVVGQDGSCSAFDLALAIIQAVDSGADIISISLAAVEGSEVLAAAVRYAQENQVLLVAAAGNDGGERISYPAAYPEVIAVGAIDAASEPAGFSNQGRELALAAPGVGLQAATGEDEWGYFSGTSAAVPCVVGVLANFLSAYPNLTSSEAAVLLLATCDDTGPPGVDDWTGQGIVNADRLDNWRTPGIYDAAAAGHHLLPDAASDGSLQLRISAQNTGTEILPELLLQITAGEAITRESFANILPGEVVSSNLALSPEVVRAAGRLVISSQVETPGVTDARAGNQRKQSSLSLKE